MNLFGSKKAVECVLQSEASECGLASMAMVARFHGQKIDLPYLRALRPVSRKGLTFANIIELANQLGFDSRGFALESLDDLEKVSLPAILHWNGNHFVVLEAITPRGYVIQDPAFGKRVYAKADMARHFAGVALEIEPRIDFVKIKAERKGSLWSLLKSIRGLESSLAQILVVSFGVSVLSLMVPIILQVALDVVLPQFDLDLLAIVSIGLAFFAIFEAIGLWLRNHIILRSASLFQTSFTRNIVGHAFRLPLRFFENRHPGDIVARMDSIQQVKQFLANGLVVAFTESIMSLMVLGLMFYYSPMLTGFVVATLVILMFLRMVSFPALKEASAASLAAHSEERSKLIDGLRRADTLKVHNAADNYNARWFESFVHYVNHDYRALSIELRADLALRVLMAACTVLTLYFGITAVMQSDMSVGMLYAFFALRTSFFDKMDHLVRELLHFSVLSVHLRRIEEMTQETPEVLRENAGVERRIRNSVKIDGVNVQFSEGEDPIVRDATFTVDVAGNESIAIIGASGSGKSSLLKIIASLHAPHKGQIIVDGQPLARFGLAEYRGNLGVVFADDGVFAGTIADNVTLFRNDVSTEQIVDALEAVGLAEELARLPQGLATIISEETPILSTGQRRRLLAARAICQSPRLYLLDEVTANLDPKSEAALVRGLLAQQGGKIFVTHSEPVLALVDKVYRVEDGMLVLTEDRRLIAAE